MPEPFEDSAWIVAAVPWGSSEFVTSGNHCEQHQIDPLTAVMNELGLVLEHDDDAGGLTAGKLVGGVQCTEEHDDYGTAIDHAFAQSSDQRNDAWLRAYWK